MLLMMMIPLGKSCMDLHACQPWPGYLVLSTHYCLSLSLSSLFRLFFSLISSPLPPSLSYIPPPLLSLTPIWPLSLPPYYPPYAYPLPLYTATDRTEGHSLQRHDSLISTPRSLPLVTFVPITPPPPLLTRTPQPVPMHHSQ